MTISRYTLSMPLPSATVVRKVSPYSPQAGPIAEAAQAVREGQLVAFPTETVYGLGADAMNAEAVRRIFTAKGRPADNPLIVHISKLAELEPLVSGMPAEAEKLASAFWPGPLTIVLPKASPVPSITSAGLDTVAIRMPAHRVALALVEAAGTPIAAPSANRSGSPSPTRAEHVLSDLGGNVAIVLDAGPCDVGLESTVVDVTVDPPVVLRPGGVTLEALRDVLKRVVGPGVKSTEVHRSPGTRHRHYAPKAKVIVTDHGQLASTVARWVAQGSCVAVMTTKADLAPEAGALIVPMTVDAATYARNLFASLRTLDSQGFDVIIVEAIDEQGIGMAIMDRLRRAAEGSAEIISTTGARE